MVELQALLGELRTAFGPQVLTLLGLTLAQVLLAVAVALKNGNFRITKLADFFRTMIVPKLLGWLACAALAQFVLPEYLPGGMGPGIATAAFVALVASYAGAIVENLQELGLVPQQLNGILGKLGIWPGGVPF